ncbi:MAG: hypothetical protein EBS93_08450 [Chitinophagia bacterium]|nr:hypothetical protein [Chitinophagia bacterium]
MARPKKEVTQTVNDTISVEVEVNAKTVSPNDLEWTDHVLGLLHEDEKISGNPTTDGLRRIFEKVLNCTVVSVEADVVQSPDLANERRATVVYSMGYVLNDPHMPESLKYRSVSAAADVYWGNCDKVYRNHPVAVAETRAEGRALRKALKLRKVVTADEVAKEIVDHASEVGNNTINTSQLNFFDVFGKRLNVNIKKLLDHLAINSSNVYNISYDDAVKTIATLSGYQQSNDIPKEVLGYDSNWK